VGKREHIKKRDLLREGQNASRTPVARRTGGEASKNVSKAVGHRQRKSKVNYPRNSGARGEENGLGGSDQSQRVPEGHENYGTESRDRERSRSYKNAYARKPPGGHSSGPERIIKKIENAMVKTNVKKGREYRKRVRRFRKKMEAEGSLNQKTTKGGGKASTLG